jgi:alpha-tubulin suppressor-like RCC1 family protein
MKKTVLTAVVFLLFTVNNFAQCWTQVAAGSNHTVALKSDGTLWAWGLNDKGQLGDGTTINRTVPTQIGTNADWAKIDSFESNNLAIKTDGSLWAWGNNFNGQNGNGNYGAGAMDLIPTRVGLDNDWANTAGSVFAIKTNGTLWGWGSNSNGRLGTGDFQDHFTPVQIGTDSNWVAISGASNQTLALKSDHTLWGWGLNKSGSLAIGVVDNFVLVPTQTGNNSADWQKIDVGGCCSSKMIKVDGTLWAMGSANFGNLGIGTVSGFEVNIPTMVGNDASWNSVTTTFHSAAIKNDSSLWAWGLNGAGELGDGSLVNKTVPTQVGNSNSWLSVVSGSNHTAALSSNGTLFTWGYNNNGQLGDGTLNNKNLPTQIGEVCNLSTKRFGVAKDLKIFPNPASNNISIRYHLNTNDETELRLTTLTGQKVFEQKITSTKGTNYHQIDLSTYSQGIYLLTVKTESYSATVKVIKE